MMNTTVFKKQEISSLTGLRGIAATMVMLYHFRINNVFTGPIVNFLTHGYLMVDLFLILSGFILTMTYGKRFTQRVGLIDYGNYLIKRVARIYPLYFLMTITSGLLISYGLMDRWPGPEIFVSGVVNFTMLQSLFHIPSLDAPGWSVSAEWIANLLFPFFIIVLFRLSRLWLGLVTIAIFCGLIILTSLPILAHAPKRSGLLDIWNYTTVYPVVRCVADFILGIIVFQASKFKWIEYLTALKLFSPILGCIIIVSMFFNKADIFIVLLFSFFILALIPNDNLASKFMRIKPIYRLGEISYAIYLIHNQLNYLILFFAKQLIFIGFDKNFANGLSILLFSLIVIGLSELSYRFIERPARDAINKFSFKQERPLIITYQ